MKKNFHKMFLMFITISLVSSVAMAIELTDYENPNSEYQEAFIRGEFNSNTGNQDQTSYDYSSDLNYLYNQSSIYKNIRFGAEFNAEGSQGPNDADKAEDTLLGNIYANYDNYFNSQTRFFWYGAGEAQYRNDADNLFGKIGAGLGYGRVIDSTALARAIRIVEELREHGVIVGEVSNAVYLELAKVVELENEYQSKYGAEEYQPQWYAAMEKALAGSNVLKDNKLGAVAALHMNRVLEDERISVRKYGWFLRAGVGYIISNFDGVEGDPSLDVEFEYAHPIGLRAQFTNVTMLSWIIDDKPGYALSNEMRYTYELSDKLDWENTWNITYNKKDTDPEEVLSNRLSTTIGYYLTNRFILETTLSATHNEDYTDKNGNDDIELATSFGIRYRLK